MNKPESTVPVVSEPFSGGTAGAADQVGPDDVSVIVSDMHMSEGLTARVRRKPGLLRRIWRKLAGWLFEYGADTPQISPLNVLEDFPDDGVFVSFLEKILELYGNVGTLHLRLLGDTFDPLAVSYDGKFTTAPTEEVCSAQARKIIRGHPGVLDAMAAFIRRPNCRLDFYVGNHDLFLVWKDVQRIIVERIAGGDREAASRIRFVDQESGFEECDRHVIYEHGMSAEAHTVIDPKNVVLTQRFGQAISKPILNMPYGSYMVTGLINPIKLRNPLVGRMTSHKTLWKTAALHRWGWGFYAAVALVWNFLFNAFFAFWDIRRKTNLRNTLRIVFETFSAASIDRYAVNKLKERGAKVIFMGHTHEWKRISSPEGTYINTGAWTQMYELVEPEIELRWQSFRRLEFVVRVLGHFIRTGKVVSRVQFTKILGWLATVAAMTAFLFTSFPREGWSVYDYEPADLKLPVAIMLIFVLISGVIRMLAVKPYVRWVQRLTFGLVCRYGDTRFNAELMEYLPDQKTFRECV